MFCKSVKLFRSRCKDYRKSRFFQKKNPQSLHLDSPNEILTALGEDFFPENQKNFVKVLSRLKNQNVSQKKFSICFPGHGNCVFENRIVICLLNAIKNFPANDQNCLLKAQKLQENHQFLKGFSSKTSPGHLRWSFEKHTANMFDNSSRSF